MCRRNELLGCATIAFGVGVLVGTWLDGGLFCHLFGVAGIFLGLTICRKK